VLGARLMRDLERLLAAREQQLDYLARRLVHPGERIAVQTRHLGQLVMRLKSAASRMIESSAWRVSEMAAALRAKRPDVGGLLAANQEARLRLNLGYARYLELHDNRLAQLRASLGHLNPQAVLERGYSIVARDDGRIVRSALDVAPGERVQMTFGQGAAQARIEDVTKP